MIIALEDIQLHELNVMGLLAIQLIQADAVISIKYGVDVHSGIVCHIVQFQPAFLLLELQ
jgi:hypothetical protein